MRAFTFTPLLELPHQPTERDSHDTDDNRSQAEGNVDSIIRGYVVDAPQAWLMRYENRLATIGVKNQVDVREFGRNPDECMPVLLL